MKSVILFLSTNHALWAADLLQQHQIRGKMIPIPRNLSSDCGYCVEFDSADREKVLFLLQENKIEYDRIEAIK